MFKYSATITLTLIVLLIYWELNNVVYIIMILTKWMRQHFFNVHFPYDYFHVTVLKYILVSALSMSQLLWKVLILLILQNHW